MIPVGPGVLIAAMVAALAVHSVCGFTGAFVGPVIFGAALDGFGGETAAGTWLAAFGVLAGMIALWPLATLLARLRRV